MRSWAVIGISFFVAGGCASRDQPVGCAELVVNCPAGAEQQWWLASTYSAYDPMTLRLQGGDCGSWLAFIKDGATARYDNVDLGAREGQTRLRVLVSADDMASPTGGTLSLFADDMTTAVTSCRVMPTGGWFNWLVVDCGILPLQGPHTLTFKFNGTAQYVFNFAAFGVARSGSPDCTVTGPKLYQ